MVSATTITREAPFLEDFRRRLLQGAFDLTKQAQPGTTPRGIAALDPLQTGAIQQYARTLGLDPTTGAPTGTAAARPLVVVLTICRGGVRPRQGDPLPLTVADPRS